MSECIKTVNPLTEECLKEYKLMSADDANSAVDKAHQRFLSWSQKSLYERCELANKLADEIEDNRTELVDLMVSEMGKVRSQGEQEVALCSDICRYTANTASNELNDEHRDFDGGSAIVCYRPIGVILGIQPWNFPLYQVIRYSITNLVAGNTTVLKHASNVAGMSEMIEKLYRNAGFPESCFQSLLVDGETANKLIEHDKIRGVTFTGSDEIGKKVAETAAKNVKKTVLELGSNDGFIVLGDADLDIAIKSCLQGRMINNGETCVAAKRFIVVDAIYDDFKAGLVKAMQDLTMGDPRHDDTDLGPMARKDLRDELHKQVQESISAGAALSLGGEIPNMRGYFYPVTLLEDVKPGMPAYDDELFGPVVSLIKAKDDDDAIRIANDSRYGLGGGIFSKDEKKAIKLAKLNYDTGMINVNGYGLAQPNLPFGGVKNSGYGREHGGFGIREFVNIKTIMISKP